MRHCRLGSDRQPFARPSIVELANGRQRRQRRLRNYTSGQDAGKEYGSRGNKSSRQVEFRPLLAIFPLSRASGACIAPLFHH
jgi:hypothetical protein